MKLRGVYFLLFFFFYLFIPWYALTKSNWNKLIKISITIICLLILFGIIINIYTEQTTNEIKKLQVTQVINQETMQEQQLKRQTAIASSNLTSTVLALTPSATYTKTPIPTDTPRPTITPDMRKEAKVINYKLIAKDPDKYKGEYVKFSGRVFQIEASSEGEAIQIWVNNNIGDNLIIYSYQESDIVEDDYLTVYGIISGSLEGKNAFGGNTSAPMIIASIIDKK